MFLKKREMITIIVSIIILSLTVDVAAKKKSIQFSFVEKENWKVVNGETKHLTYKGKEAFRIKRAEGSKIAYLKDFNFQNGIIELDIAGIPFYTGLVFRVQSDYVYEGIYFRPQNSSHQDPIRQGHTVQYIASPAHPWYFLREKFPEKYEAHAKIPLREWFHVKVVIDGTKAEVYVNNDKKPCLVVEKLFHGFSMGSIGVWSGNGSGGTFANLKVIPRPFKKNQEKEVSSPPPYTREQEFLFNTFKQRRSVRKFKSSPIPIAHIMKILDIARAAPTSGNQQPWKFLVIRERMKLDQLKEACLKRRLDMAKARGTTDPGRLEEIRKRTEKYYSSFLSAPVYILVLTDSASKYPSYNRYDGSLAAGHLMIAARSLGYGSVFATDSIPYEVIKKTFSIPEQFEFVCFTPVGVPEKWPTPPEKKSLSEFVVFEKFISGVNYQHKEIKKAKKLDPAVFKKYMGKYEINPQFAINITVEGNRIFAQATAQPKVEIFPESETKFFLKVVNAQITFQVDGKGKATGLTLHQGGRDIPAKKVE